MAGVAVVIAGVVAGCSGSATTGSPGPTFSPYATGDPNSPDYNKSSTEGPPLVICGTTFVADAFAPGAFDILVPHRKVVTTLQDAYGQRFPYVYLQVAAGCTHGSTVTITPAGSARIAMVARARDGKDAAVAVQPEPGVKSVITATQGGHRVGSIAIDIPKQSP